MKNQTLRRNIFYKGGDKQVNKKKNKKQTKENKEYKRKKEKKERFTK